MPDESRKSSVEATVSEVLPMAYTRGRVVEIDGVLYIDTGINWVPLPSGSGLTQQQIEGLI